MKPEQFQKLKGHAESKQYRHDVKTDTYVKDITAIRGLAKALKRAKKFVLQVDTEFATLYIAYEGFVTDRKQARQFAYGFDEEEAKLRMYTHLTGLKLKIRKL